MPRPSVREDIVQSALKQFHRLGFNGCSVDDITRAAGVPKGSFYNHFKAKEELAIEVLDRYSATAPNDILLRKDVPPLKRLKRHFAALGKLFLTSDCRQGCMLANFASELADHSTAVRKDLAARFSGWVERIASVIREAQQTGAITATQEPELLAGFLLSAWEGTLLRARAGSGPAALKEFHAVAFNQLLT